MTVVALLVILFSQLFNLFRFGREVISAMRLIVRLVDNLGLSFGSRWFSFGPIGPTVGPLCTIVDFLFVQPVCLIEYRGRVA